MLLDDFLPVFLPKLLLAAGTGSSFLTPKVENESLVSFFWSCCPGLGLPGKNRPSFYGWLESAYADPKPPPPDTAAALF